ncbi:MAG: aminotransferase class V-fold PLP-dependent enzyme [Rhodobacterales bacterium]
MTNRVYLDWNATAPLRVEAHAAMIAAMETVGNPSSVHAEGRAAKSIVERARAQVAQAFGAVSADIVFTASATEAAALALNGRGLQSALVEHDCVSIWTESVLQCDRAGDVAVIDPQNSTLQHANSETGVIQTLPQGLAVSDFVQSFGKIPVGFDWSGAKMGLLSTHKIGGPKGVGALVLRQGVDLAPYIRGGGQEMGRRAGTENVIGIAGFGAAAEAAAKDLSDGVWERVESLRDLLEERVVNEVPETIIMGYASKRLPNTSAFAVRGWKGETQVMQMDLAGFAISAGSACSSGKVKPSKVLLAMGCDDLTAASAIRVSIGPTTTETDILRFGDAWIKEYQRFAARAA